MYRDYVPPNEVTNPTTLPLSENTKKGKPLFLYGLILLLLGFLLTSWGLIYIVLTTKDVQIDAVNSTSLPQEEVQDATTQKITEGSVSNLSNAEESKLPENIKSSPVPTIPINLEAVKNAVSGTEYNSIYSKAIGSANDAKIRADLSALATTLVILMNEDGLPENFPKSPRCIGTITSCYDLYKYIVPEFLDKPYLHPNGGTTENTMYFVGLANDEYYSVVLQSTGADGQIIEVKK